MVGLLLDDRVVTETSSDRQLGRIVVVGIGNDGRNRIQRMLGRNVSDVSFIVVDADPATVDTLGNDITVIQLRESSQLRPEGLRSWDADVDLMPGERADSSAVLRAAMANADLVFITAGMHRDIDQKTVARVSSIAKENQALVVGVVTAVFSFEESQLSHAVTGAGGLTSHVDNLIVIHNDRLPDFVDWDSGLLPALANADEIVAEGIMDLAELLTCPGKIDVSLADFKSIMSQPGPAVMSTGVGRGNNGALDAVHQAIDSSFVGDAVKAAQGIIFSIKGGEKLSLGDVYSVGNLIGDFIGKKADMRFGMTIDSALRDEVRLTLIATSLNQGKSGYRRLNSLIKFDKVASNTDLQDHGTPHMGLLPQAEDVDTGTEKQPAANINLESNGHSTDRKKSVFARLAASFGAISRLLAGPPTTEKFRREHTIAAEMRAAKFVSIIGPSRWSF